MRPFVSMCEGRGARQRWGRLFCAALLAACSLAPLGATGRLFFIEAQAVGGYSFLDREIIYHSQDELDPMQKSGLGFDFIQRFTKASRDIAVLSLQARLAFDFAAGAGAELQVYNAFLKFKPRPFDIWIGHNRPHFGLASQFDQHAHLLQPLVMNGFGFDRDWGIGLERDTAWGDFGVSLTAGSGMPLHLQGNWLLAGRVAKGVLERDNVQAGFSLAIGKTLDVMGGHVLSMSPQSVRLAEFDLTWMRNSLENRLEIAIGDREHGPTAALLWRVGLNLLNENRLKLEAQPAWFRESGRSGLQLSFGLTFLADADWTMRAMYLYDRRSRDSRLVFQVYFYKGLDV